MPVLGTKAPKIRGAGQPPTNQEAARLTAGDPLAGSPQHLDAWLFFWTSFAPDVSGSCPPSIRGLGLGNYRSPNKGESEKGEARLENIEIHPDFLPAKGTGCAVGSRGLRGREWARGPDEAAWRFVSA